MTDFKEFLFTDDFKAYRKKQIQVIALYIHDNLYTNNASETRGALELAQKIIGLPSTLLDDRELEENLNRLIKEDMAGITKYLLIGRMDRRDLKSE